MALRLMLMLMMMLLWLAVGLVSLLVAVCGSRRWWLRLAYDG